MLATPCLTKAADIAGYNLPDSLQRFDSVYSLSGCGLREFLFSDIYLLGMYLPLNHGDVSEIADAGVGKIFLLEVLYDGTLPDDIPDLWREPLAEQLSTEMLEILQHHYDQIESGDRIEFSYQPSHGEELRINDEVIVEEQERELIPALLELWLGDDPVSGNLKRLLLNGSCD